MPTNRNWMWGRKDNEGYLLDEFVEGVKGFLRFAYEHPRFVIDNKIRCPCSKCRNKKFYNQNDVSYHLIKNGFTHGYDKWYAHGEPLDKTSNYSDCERVHDEGSRYRAMVMEGVEHGFDWDSITNEQPPNYDAQKFFDLLKDADAPLWDGCKNHTKLSAVTQLLNLKSEYNMPEACYDRLVSIIKSMLPESENLPPNLYKTKKQLANLGLGYKRIDACVNNYGLKKYKEKQNVHDQSSHPSFDLASWCDVAGCPTKGRVYGYGSDQHFERACSGSSFSSSNEMCSNQINNELSKEIEEMRAIRKKMEEEFIESNKKLELVIMESKLREENVIKYARQREENLKGMARKIIQDVGYTNHSFAGGSGFRE